MIRPSFLWRLFTPTAGRARRADRRSGSRESVHRRVYPFLDEQALGGPSNLEVPPPVAVFPVEDPVKIVRAKPADRLGGDRR